MHFTINHNLNLNYGVEFKAVLTNQKREHVYLNVNIEHSAHATG